MAFYHSLLSRLFGGDPAEEASPPEQAVDAEIPQAPTPDPRLLQLPPDHVVYRLWDLRVRQKGWLPQPAFRLAERPDLPPVMDDEEIRKELLRLQLAVNSSANSRLMELGAPKAPVGDGGEPAVPDLDAQAVVFTTLSGMAAWLLIYPPRGRAGRSTGSCWIGRWPARGSALALTRRCWIACPKIRIGISTSFPAPRGSRRSTEWTAGWWTSSPGWWSGRSRWTR